MRKIMCTAAAALLTASLTIADDPEVYSVNIVGFQKVELPANQFILTAMNFEVGDNTLLDIFGTDTLKQNNNFLLCDRVLIYDPLTQTYQTWAQWTDGKFYKANSLAEWNQSIEGNPVVPLGSGFFLRSGSSSEANIIGYTGDAVLDEEMPIPLSEGFQILSYPFSSDIALQDTSFAADGAAKNNNFLLCDRVYIYENGAYQAYALWTDNKWYKANSLAEWNQSILASNTIRMGQSFFYRAMGAITWSETNKYLQALID